jgi:hypothetical protein
MYLKNQNGSITASSLRNEEALFFCRYPEF